MGHIDVDIMGSMGLTSARGFMDMMPVVACNICGGTAFLDHKSRERIRCKGCGATERTRVLAMHLDKFVDLRPGLRVLHFAPERPIFWRIAEHVGASYHVRDRDRERYAELKVGEIAVETFDLCTDCPSLPSNYYDVVLHNHVIEHLMCNVTAVLWHLHRALKPDGLHMFSIPISDGRYEEGFEDLSETEREARFHQKDHYRNFGRDDLSSTIGMIFDIEDQIRLNLLHHFGEDALRRNNIPESKWHAFTGASLFMLRKHDLRLQ